MWGDTALEEAGEVAGKLIGSRGREAGASLVEGQVE